MTTIDFNNYQLFDKGYKVYRQDQKARVLVQDTDGQWFNAIHKDGVQFSPVSYEQKQVVVGSLFYIANLCAKFTTPEAALAARPWEC